MSKTSKTAPSTDTPLDFEQSMEHLDELVEQLEQGDLSLDESLKAFEQGIKLTRECQQQLASAEQKVALLIGDNDELRTVDFDAND